MKNTDITKANVELVEKMIEKVKAMDSKEVVDFIEKISIFHHYSFYNQIILYCAGACNVKGFQQWKQIGRSVKKGAKAIWILAPKKYSVKETNEAGEDVTRTFLKGFISVPVFDYKDTEGEPLPERGLVEKSAVSLYDMLAVARELNFKVQREEMAHSVGGCINQAGDIFLNTLHSEKENAGTLIHELAHGLLEHHKRDREKSDTATVEQEAEILAHVICHRIGIERHSEIYLKAWGASDGLLKSFSKIDRAAKKFLEAMDKTQAAA